MSVGKETPPTRLFFSGTQTPQVPITYQVKPRPTNLSHFLPLSHPLTVTGMIISVDSSHYIKLSYSMYGVEPIERVVKCSWVKFK